METELLADGQHLKVSFVIQPMIRNMLWEEVCGPSIIKEVAWVKFKVSV